jgi:hypothetical protein
MEKRGVALNMDITQLLFLVVIAHSFMAMLLGNFAAKDHIKKEYSPFNGVTNGFVKEACVSDEFWERTHRFHAKRRVFWAYGELIVGLIMCIFIQSINIHSLWGFCCHCAYGTCTCF